MTLRLKTLGILCLVVCMYLFTGKRDKRRGTIKKVVVYHGGKLGDMICATPVFRAIKEKYPDCKVVVVGNATNKNTLSYNPDVDTYLIHQEGKTFEIIRDIKKEKADFGCILAPGAFGLAILYLANIPLVAVPILKEGWSPFETKTYKFLSRFVVTKDYIKGKYLPGQFLTLLEPIGISTTKTQKYVYWSDDADAKVNDFIEKVKAKDSFRVGIMPGAGNKIKQWPAERFGVVADYLIETHNAKIFVIGNESNRIEINTMLESMRHREKVQDCSWTTIDEIKALVSKMDMTVSVDTGPIFIAEACGVPTIDIGGVIHPTDMAPNDGIFHVLITYDGEPLLWSMNSRVYDHEAARKGVESITVDTVIGVTDELIKRIKNT